MATETIILDCQIEDNRWMVRFVDRNNKLGDFRLVPKLSFNKGDRFTIQKLPENAEIHVANYCGKLVIEQSK